ncbi:hypothetical protein EUGRSUZ_B02723 [Eucalyptus grandis]|uniref:Uncharacterized protein n=2 Tax=Eucalyptus grandis TaxID=71139 RepID=A0ACC3M233_EUCGR|nr:hypothetical protein EUGRSUZ_B02723 [Eucalyptus grandis]
MEHDCNLNYDRLQDHPSKRQNSECLWTTNAGMEIYNVAGNFLFVCFMASGPCLMQNSSSPSFYFYFFFPSPFMFAYSFSQSEESIERINFPVQCWGQSTSKQHGIAKLDFGTL